MKKEVKVNEHGELITVDKTSKIVNMGEEANKGFVKRDDSKTVTRLLDKNWSPLIVRKYQMKGWPLFIAVICDANLNDLDQVVYNATETAENNGFFNGGIQDARNYCGFLSEEIINHYNNIKRGCMEGLLVFYYIDKCAISSAFGDLMTHEKCVAETYHIINTLPHI